jgi:DNA repair photolyase
VENITGDEYLKGRGAQYRSHNPYDKLHVVQEHWEGLDEPLLDGKVPTQVFIEHPRNIVNKVNSDDVGMLYSLNPYQGCEHGCIYCYARNSHQYWGYSAGLDFESKIMVKPDAPRLLREFLDKRSWQCTPIGLSGNTDCYQPLESKYRITRQLLEVFLEYRNPVGIITKNKLILRDVDVLKQLAEKNLVHVMITVTSLNEDLRLKMEPRTAAYAQRLKVIEALAKANIPVGVMIAPIIPGLNSHEIPVVMKAAADAGAQMAGYTVVRLNGSIQELFRDWLQKNYPDRFNKVWKQIAELHAGKVNDSVFGRRMRGEGVVADSISRLFKMSKHKYMTTTKSFALNTSEFCRPPKGQLPLF